MCVVKTWLNAWTTTARFHHRVVLPCLLGCTNAQDTLAHYIICPRLWRAVRSATRGPMLHDPFQRIGVLHAEEGLLKDLAVAYSVYHYLRHTPDLSERAWRSSDYRELAASVRAQAGIAARAFGRA